MISVLSCVGSNQGLAGSLTSRQHYVLWLIEAYLYFLMLACINQKYQIFIRKGLVKAKPAFMTTSIKQQLVL
jgi:hypothetical protein